MQRLPPALTEIIYGVSAENFSAKMEERYVYLPLNATTTINNDVSISTMMYSDTHRKETSGVNSSLPLALGQGLHTL
jgi:hypothetical protein